MMNEEAQKKIVVFLELVNEYIQSGMSYRDALDLAAVTVGDFIPSVISRATNKYQEATHPKMALSQQENVDALAFASMGKLWHGESSNENAPVTLEDLLAQSVYLILKYGKEENGREAVLEANEKIPGDKEARAVMIKMALL